MSWKLAIVEGPDQGREFNVPMDRPFKIGRGTASDTQIRDAHLSRVHCELRIDNGHLTLVDAGSSTGTFVAGRRIDSAVRIDSGDEFHIGGSKLRLLHEGSLDARTILGGKNGKAKREKLLQADHLVGETIYRYRIEKLVSRGKSGFVYKAFDTKRQRWVAIKILAPELANTDVQRKRFVRAVRTMLPIRHPHIVRLYQAGTQVNLCWAAMEWIDGTGVDKVIEDIGIRGALEWRDVWRVAVHITRALVEASKKKIVHRNITPSNILRRDQDRSYLLSDLILARALEETDATQLTRPGDIVGELSYLAPERIMQPAIIDRRSDLFSLGATLYTLLSGKPPYAAASASEVISKTLKGDASLPGKEAMGMDERFSDLVMKLIRPDPDDRYDDAVELLKDLDRVGRYGGLEADWSYWV